MKSCMILFTAIEIFLFSINLSANALNVNFDGSGGGTNYYGGNVPMPSAPSPPPSSYSDNDNSQSQHTYSTQKKKSSSGSLFTPQMRDEIVDTVYKQWVQQQQLAKQKAIEAQKQAELKKKQEEAKKKANAQKWINEYQNDMSSVKLDNQNIGVNPYDLKKSDPKMWGGLDSFVPSMPNPNTSPPVEKSAVKKLEEAAISPVKSTVQKPQPESPKPDKCALSESQLRAEYYSADRKLGECMKGSIQCSPEEVRTLEVKRESSQNGLNLHYNYKYDTNGNFIKSPYKYDSSLHQL